MESAQRELQAEAWSLVLGVFLLRKKVVNDTSCCLITWLLHLDGSWETMVGFFLAQRCGGSGLKLLTGSSGLELPRIMPPPKKK